MDGKKTLKLPARVVVSHLNLGGHSPKGAYYDRLSYISIIGNGKPSIEAPFIDNIAAVGIDSDTDVLVE